MSLSVIISKRGSFVTFIAIPGFENTRDPFVHCFLPSMRAPQVQKSF